MYLCCIIYHLSLMTACYNSTYNFVNDTPYQQKKHVRLKFHRRTGHETPEGGVEV